MFRITASRLSKFILAAFIATSFQAKSQALDDREAYRLELNSLFETIDTFYGPLAVKQKTIGLDWAAKKKEYAARIDGLKGMNDFYFLISDVMNSMNDAHIAMELPSTLVWSLPLQFSAVENKVIVNYYNSVEMTAQKCPVALGDELTTIGGKTFEQVQSSQPVFAKDGNPITNRGIFARQITSLNEARGVRLADFGGGQTVVFGLKNAKGADYICSLTYKADGTGLIDRPIGSPAPVSMPFLDGKDARFSFDATLDALLGKDGNLIHFSKEDRDKMFQVQQLLEQMHALMNLTTTLGVPVDDPTKKDVGGMGQKLNIGDLKPFFKLPADFKKIEFPAVGALLNQDAYFAGTFTHNGKNVGFLRIPSYMPTVVYTMPLGLNYIMSKLKNTDYLIIDQTNNPGGMVAYSDMLVKSLTGVYDISKHLRFLVKPTQGYLTQFATVINGIENDKTGTIPQEAKDLLPTLKANYEIIHTAFVNHANLSQPVSMMVTTKFIEIVLNQLYSVLPAHKILEQYLGAQIFTPQTYEFPVYMMINEFDFSGGDATPATLQDYGRVKLIGVRTAGAGGSVEEFRNTVTTDYKFHMTTSLMYRKNGTFVENYGVTPDIPLSLMKSDYDDSFAQVMNKVLGAIDSQR